MHFKSGAKGYLMSILPIRSEEDCNQVMHRNDASPDAPPIDDSVEALQYIREWKGITSN
jgi:hypothetical protein